jgi:hypothetical protein
LLIIHSSILLFLSIAFCFSGTYLCGNQNGLFNDLIRNKENSTLLIGEIVGVLSAPCDTIIDTIGINYNINIDTISGSIEEQKRNKLKLKIRNLEIQRIKQSGYLIRNDSAVIRKREKHMPLIYVVKPESFCSLPAKIDTVSFQSYHSTSLEMQHFKGKFIVAGHISKSVADSINVYFVDEPHIYLNRLDENLKYDCDKEINYRLTMEYDSAKIDWDFELLKELPKLVKEISPEKRVKTLKNLMYHKCFLHSPMNYTIITLYSLPDIDEKIRTNLIETQKEISNNWNASQNYKYR